MKDIKSGFIPRLSPLEAFLIQVILYILLWLGDDFYATLASLAFGGLFLSIWIISRIAEWIEPSKVPRWYFSYLLGGAMAPVLVSIIFYLINGLPSWVLLQ